jgi:hypothetical protein
MTLHELQTQLQKLAAMAGLGDEALPTFGSSSDSARPHIEARDGVYYYVVCERGVELERTLFIDEDELFYHALEKATSEAAGDRETANRSDEQHDSRRELFRIQEELMARIKAAWGTRVARKHAEVLRRYPFDDAAVARLNRFKELRALGVEEDEAWKRACQEYPEPDSG